MSNLIRYGVVRPLCKLSSRYEASGTNALAALLYLSSHGTSLNQCIEDMLDCGAVSRMTEIALSSPARDENATDSDSKKMWRKRVNFALGLLANMTRTEKGAIDLCGRSMPDDAVPSSMFLIDNKYGDGEEKGNNENKIPSRPTMSLLLSRFLSDAYIRNGGATAKNNDEDDSPEHDNIEDIASREDDPYQHFSAVLMNATQVEQGRKFVMRIHRKGEDKTAQPTSVLQSIVSNLRSNNPVRRQGIAGTVKNCCFEKDSAWWLINEVNIIKYILYPLAGPEELDVDEKKGMDPDLWLEGPDKVRETDSTTRLLLLEAILLLCASGRKSREALRLQRTYVILKMADMVEDSEEVSELINECVQFLRRDEEGTAEGSSDRLIDETYGGTGDNTRGMLALPAPSAAHHVGARSEEENYDEID